MHNIDRKQYYDQLTEVYNRHYFEKKIKEFDPLLAAEFIDLIKNRNKIEPEFVK